MNNPKSIAPILGRTNVMSCPSIFLFQYVFCNLPFEWMSFPWVAGERWPVCWAAHRNPAWGQTFLWRTQAGLSGRWLRVLLSGTFPKLKTPRIQDCPLIPLLRLFQALHSAAHGGCVLWARVHSPSLVFWVYSLILLPLAGRILFNFNFIYFFKISTRHISSEVQERLCPVHCGSLSAS